MYYFWSIRLGYQKQWIMPTNMYVAVGSVARVVETSFNKNFHVFQMMRFLLKSGSYAKIIAGLKPCY